MTDIDSVLARADANLSSSMDTLFELVRIKSISTDPVYKGDCRAAAEYLARHLSGLGFDASVRETEGNPVVVAHHEGGAPGCPHILFYGHYDVQPVDPLELWTHDPFEPAIRDAGNGRKIITGRGTSDDKGQLLTFLEAVRAFKETRGALPVRLTVLFEGEEESGSPSLKPFLLANAKELSADFAMVCDTSMWDAETPAICASLRGLVGEEVVITAADRDLHSGGYGGAAANPLHIMSDILAGLHDKTGAVTLPGFYDGVDEVPEAIKTEWRQLEESSPGFLTDIGLAKLSGEQGRSRLELIWARPTAEVNGISGGYAGEGFKTVIAAKATAKVSFRLVGRQDPLKIRESFRAYVRSKVPEDCQVAFASHGASPGIQLPYNSPVLDAAKAALSKEWPKKAIVVGGGGSIPVVGDFHSILGMDSLLTGFSLADDRVHSPNEKYDLMSFHKGIRSWVRILDAVNTK